MRLYEQLKKELLVEGIKEVQAKYPSIEESKFYELIKLDPTYKEGVDSVGTYGKWILNLYNKNRLKDEDFYKVTDYLTEFEQKKKWIKQKDIGQYKTLPELAKALEEVSIELSQNQKDRAFKKRFKQAELDADLVYEDSDWEVWIPKTYESSCKLATNTEWCTGPSSHGNDYYYSMYTSKGPLYINLNKNDEDEKYQFHFPTKQFMDRHDSPIQLVDLLNKKGNEGLRSFYISLLKPEIDKIKENIQKNSGSDIPQSAWNSAFEDFMNILGELALDPEFKDDLDYFLSRADFFISSYDFEGNRDMSEDFIQACFEGDLWDKFYFGDVDALTEYIVDDINEKTKDVLVKFDFPRDTYELLLKGELPEEYEEFEVTLQDCLYYAARDAYTVGSEAAALSDFAYALKNSAPKGAEFVSFDDTGAIYKITREWLEENLDEIDYEMGYSSSDYFDGILSVLGEQVNDNFDFREPQYGWDDFDVDTFNSSLQEALYDNYL